MIKNLLLVGFSLLSWAWLSATWAAAIVLLLLITVSQIATWRWTFSPMQFIRIGDLTTLLVILLLVDVYFVQPVEMPIFVLLKWLPVLFAPILLIQIVSTQGQLPLATLFYSLRKPWLNSQETDTTSIPSIDFNMPYAGLSILAAGAANVQNASYFALATASFIAILWFVRPSRASLALWLINIALAVFISYHGYHGLHQLNSLIEEKSVEWLSNWQTDPFSGRTSIGDVGNLKLSDRIEFRLRAEGPLLLHQTSFDLYSGQYWIASDRQFLGKPSKPPADTGPLKIVEFYQNMPAEAVLALPDGAVSITGLELAELQYTAMGAVKATLPPQFADYEVSYDGRRTGDPGRFDLQLPKQHLDWLKQYAEKMQLQDQPPATVAANIKRYFQHQFFYSLYLGKDTNSDKALRNFMLERHAGHCEYFATATVFLLRYAGIPARLANGYSVSEYDDSQNLFIVRRRHAHAWTLAYIDGLWRPIDSTPWQWQTMEQDNASLWQPVSDLFSNAVFYFRQWQLQERQDEKVTVALTISGLLIVYLLWRFFGARQRQQNTTPTPMTADYQGPDSEFYLIDQQLQNTPLARTTNESIQQWIKRLDIPDLTTIYRLHYRLRFDPLGLNQQERQEFREQTAAWLAEFQRNG